ncbi:MULTISPECIES: sodium ion-translocating decarboxylase subunit beta [Proteiniphilum]|jgi:oxaloacetate decarboxylase beta subunit|uniref:sodium ion-translocating decarboxylase subunit beta n=1 Tax=Proteiniphilum TaxID=294702 RepID=UPI001EEB38CE|nr:MULTISPECIES: sodium ion-translocating decarboxylase subunit beta [Proteiniphilum]MDD2245934.1 sodium ion-translocating decarboxylase subunit beta [Proteiniphilum sp.]MDD3909044.1 sodium ion-translocating decarboxylase subunit beta [Proteiniphilum sp.]MDD4415561.1 sodium ion-translocating decarboxylase subunit beta [Proteiniphilum sp.]ULB33131.1 sodium ion-translocating decarboxylase subunit beta [Proteiniphilum propionicum]
MGLEQLLPAIAGMTWQHLVMIAIGLILIWLAIVKNYEPTLLLPMGFGAILVNIPLSSAISQIDPATGQAVEGVLNVFFDAGIATEIFPLLIFIAIGAMIDFSPLFRNPSLLLFGAAAQFGIFLTMLLASLLGYDIKEAASIGIIGAADGPTSIVVASRFAPNLLGPISVAAYSYMALVPIIQPPVIRMLTSRNERLIRMSTASHSNKKISKKALIAFPIVITITAGIIAPSSLALIGFLMFGNLIRECGVLNKLSLSAQNELSSLVTLLLGITIASTMTAERFVRTDTLIIIALGLFAFVFDTFGGVIFAKFLNLFRKEGNKINPMIGACGISAFPMSARVIHQMGQKEDPYNYLLMPAISANVGGQIGSVVAGGIILTLVPLLA